MKIISLYTLLGILCLSLLHSCKSDEKEWNLNENSSAKIVFSLDINTLAKTRANDYVGSDDYPTIVGSELESKIIPSQLLVMAYDTVGNFVTILPIVEYKVQEGKVNFMCAFANENPNETVKYRLVVLANTNTKTAYDDVTAYLDRFVYTTPLTKAIPMWGVKSFEFAFDDAPEDRVFNLGTISLLRAAAKISVNLSDELQSEGFRIENVMINYVARDGYAVPNQWENINETQALKYSEGFRAIMTETLTDVSLLSAEDTQEKYLYVPETVNGDEELAMAVTISRGEELYEFPYDKGIKFRHYSEGQPSGEVFDIVRNHYYDYTITSLNIGLKMNLKVADWADASDWDLDLSSPVHTKIMTAPQAQAAAPSEVPTVSYNASDDEAGAFVGYFMLESPEDVVWRPTLSNASADDYEVRVYTKSDESSDIYDKRVTDAMIKAATGIFYKIVVVAKKANQVGKVVKLGITYSASWFGSNSLLLPINKANDENGAFYYPWTVTNTDNDSNQQWISILQQ